MVPSSSEGFRGLVYSDVKGRTCAIDSAGQSIRALHKVFIWILKQCMNPQIIARIPDHLIAVPTSNDLRKTGGVCIAIGDSPDLLKVPARNPWQNLLPGNWQTQRDGRNVLPSGDRGKTPRMSRAKLRAQDCATEESPAYLQGILNNFHILSLLSQLVVPNHRELC